jgi:hypothetical protein
VADLAAVANEVRAIMPGWTCWDLD